MITNAREYQITRTQLARLADALAAARGREPADRVHPDIHKAERAALESEVQRLGRELAEYDDLLGGRKTRFDSTSLEDLPSVLIQARIANRWSQKQLAVQLGVHEQQVQRWESARYRGVTFDRLLTISKSLGVSIEQKVLLAAPLVRRARDYSREMGLTDAFLSDRVLPPEFSEDPDNSMAAGLALDRFRHVFGWTADQLALPAVPPVQSEAFADARFKLPVGRNASFVRAYTAYAYRIALGTARCADHIPKKPLPRTASDVRTALLAKGPLTLISIVEWAWDMGTAIIPLPDSGAFHGACWRIDGRNVIIVKQKTQSADRLMHDVLHEVFHGAQEPNLPSRSVIDTDDFVHSVDQEEVEAATFASDVLLDGRANELVTEVARVARNHGPALKSAVVDVARRANVPTGALANHLAWVLERQTSNPLDWWGTAHNLQTAVRDEVHRMCDFAFQHLLPPANPDADVDLLFRALRASEG